MVRLPLAVTVYNPAPLSLVMSDAPTPTLISMNRTFSTASHTMRLDAIDVDDRCHLRWLAASLSRKVSFATHVVAYIHITHDRAGNHDGVEGDENTKRAGKRRVKTVTINTASSEERRETSVKREPRVPNW